jgi:hypothetical protein
VDVLAPDVPLERIVSGTSYSPEFQAHQSRAHESLLEAFLDENLTVKMIVRNSAPLAFVVPDGFDSVEFSYGAIETNPDAGCDEDLAQVVTVGEAQIYVDGCHVGANDLGTLMPGTAFLVTIPWRAASFVGLGAHHLMVAVHARFFRSIDAQA